MWLGFTVTIATLGTVKITNQLKANAAAVLTQAAALNRLAAAQEADTELTRRYYHALEDAEGER
jgi:hypothetical protein